MVKTEYLEPEMVEIGSKLFNFPWWTGYSPKRHRRGFDLIIHKDPNYYRPHRLRPILMFIIMSNMNNTYIGRFSMEKSKYLEGLSQ